MLVLVMTIQESEAAKGGAKSVINRNRRQRNRGGHGIGGHHGDDNMVDRGENLNLKHIVKKQHFILSRRQSHHWNGRLGEETLYWSLLLHQEERNQAERRDEGEDEEEETMHWTLSQEEDESHQEISSSSC